MVYVVYYFFNHFCGRAWGVLQYFVKMLACSKCAEDSRFIAWDRTRDNCCEVGIAHFWGMDMVGVVGFGNQRQKSQTSGKIQDNSPWSILKNVFICR